MAVQHLKTWIEYFEAVLTDQKLFEVRKDDRNFKVGDILILQEWDNTKQKYTGREAHREVSYIFRSRSFGVQDGYVVMSLKKL